MLEDLFTRPRLAAGLAVLALGGGVAGCGSDEGESGSSASKSGGTGKVEGGGKELVMFTITASNVYGANQIKGAQAEAKKLGYKLKVFQNEFSQPEQDKQVQQYIASGAKPAAVIFWPWIADAAVNDNRQLARLAPVIQITQEPNEAASPFVKAYSGANQQLIGRTAGEMMIQARDKAKEAGTKLTSEGGNLLVFQHPEGEKTGTERWKGFEEVTKDAPFEVLGTEYGANDPETGYEKGSQVIPKYKDKGIDFIYVSNQQAANGIIRALKENDIDPGKDVQIVSSDCSGSLDAVKEGETFGTGLQPAAIEGSLGVRTAARYLATGKVEGEEEQLEVTPEAPPIEAKPPAKRNYMPHGPAVGPEGVEAADIWGYSADQICAS